MKRTASTTRGLRAGSAGSRGTPGIPPFPTRQMLVLAMCRICEPIAFMSIFPYIYQMVDDFHIAENNDQIAVYAGMVTSAFTFAEFSTGVMWGRLSDKIGRKPVLLMGLAGTALSSLVFGFAPNLAVALIARALGGLLNGNIGVLQTTVAELVTVKEHQPRAYTIMPLVWCLGSVIGPMIGGALAQPCETFPNWFPTGNDSIWERYPYLLPNLFSAMMVFFGVTIGLLFLEETHSERKLRRDPGVELGKRIISWISFPSCQAPARKAEKQALLDDDELPGYRTNENSPQLVGSSSPIPEPTETLDLTAPAAEIEEAPAVTKTFTKPVIITIVSYGILAFHTMTFDQLFPVFLSTKPPTEKDFHLPFKFVDGFGMSTAEIGVILSVQGFYSMISTVFLFPIVVRRLGPLRLFRLLAISYFMLYLATPYLIFLPENLRMVGIYVLVIWKCTFSTMAYPSNAILLTNSAPSLLSLGTINGVAASTASLCRAFGPTVSGFLYAMGLRIGYSGLAWWVSGGITILGAVLSMYASEPRGRMDEPIRDIETAVEPAEVEGLLSHLEEGECAVEAGPSNRRS
ncbi:putative membrane protein [Colletotrichum spinosum]|uniref:Putative membrane protein n=1 Tax=Colletotrichum spinosum TaxID=1347390 RepID=A0A4V3HSH0_9PEZI|nr:putative membrane protein [Colletotrichum spinosum]